MKTITSEYLGTINACQDAITAFAEKFPKGAPVRTVFAAAIAAKDEMKKKIILYGLKLLEVKP